MDCFRLLFAVNQKDAAEFIYLCKVKRCRLL